jgi:hypothetical protein
MDEFKREYSNKDTLKEALPYFWKNFEKDNYSIWYCNYKYNSELKRIFMTCNLIGGKFCQSLHRAPPNQAKWAKFSPYISRSRPPSTLKRN